MIQSPPIQKIDDMLAGKAKDRIYKQDWKPRLELEVQQGANNVIYMLIDTANKLLYIGKLSILLSDSARTIHQFHIGLLPL